MKKLAPIAIFVLTALSLSVATPVAQADSAANHYQNYQTICPPNTRPLMGMPCRIYPGSNPPVTSPNPVIYPSQPSQNTDQCRNSAGISQCQPPTVTPVTSSTSYTKPTTASATTLPQTGPGEVVAIGLAATLFGSIGHMLYSRRHTVS